MSGYWLTCYDANGRRLGAAAPYSSREAAQNAIAVIFAISEKVREAVIWTRAQAGFGAGQWVKQQEMKRGSSGPPFLDPFACTDTEWAAWLEECDAGNGRGS